MQLQCISCRLAISGEQKRSGTQQIMQRNVLSRGRPFTSRARQPLAGKGNSISMGSAAKLGRTCNVINAGGTPSALSCISVRPSVRLRVASFKFCYTRMLCGDYDSAFICVYSTFYLNTEISRQNTDFATQERFILTITDRKILSPSISCI